MRLALALALALVLAFAAGPGLPQDLPWAGRWGGPECRHPVLLGAVQVQRDGAECDVAALVPLGGTGAVALRLDCAGSAADLVLLYDRSGDRLWLWDGPQRRAPRLMWRCEGPA